MVKAACLESRRSRVQTTTLAFKFHRNKLFLSRSLVMIQYCLEPPWPRGGLLGLRPPGLEFRILCLEASVISFISPSSGGYPRPFLPICAQRWPKTPFISFLLLKYMWNFDEPFVLLTYLVDLNAWTPVSLTSLVIAGFPCIADIVLATNTSIPQLLILLLLLLLLQLLLLIILLPLLLLLLLLILVWNISCS